MQLLVQLLRVLSLLQDLQRTAICTLNVVSRFNLKNIYLWADCDFLNSELFSHGLSIQTLKDFQGEKHSSNMFILYVNDSSFYRYFDMPVDHQAKYIVILSTSTKLKIDSIMAKFWSHNVHDVTVIFNGTVHLSLPSGCNPNRMIVSKFNCVAEMIHFHGEKYKNCPLRINWLTTEPYFIGNPSNGLEYSLLLIVAQVMKKEIIWYKEDFRGYSKNGTWIGALGNLKDIAGGDYMMSENLYNNFLLTSPHFYDSYRWYVPLMHPKNTFELFNLLSLATNILLFLYISIYFSVMSVNDKTYSSPLKCAFNVFRIGIGQSLQKTPKFTHMRILFISWVIFQMHASIIYSGRLTQKLTQKVNAVPIKTNLVKKRCISPNVEYSDDYSFLKKCNSWENIRRMVFYKNFTLLAGEEAVNFIIKRYKVSLGHNGPRYVLRYNTFVLPKNSLYYTQINHIIRQSFECGLIIKMYNDIYQQYPSENSKIKEAVDLVLFYFILSIGWSISLIALIGELTISRLQIRFNNIKTR